MGTRYRLLDTIEYCKSVARDEFEHFVDNIDHIKSFIPFSTLQDLCSKYTWDFSFYEKLEGYFNNDKELFGLQMLSMSNYKNDPLAKWFMKFNRDKIRSCLNSNKKVIYEPIRTYLFSVYQQANNLQSVSSFCLEEKELLEKGDQDMVLLKKHLIMNVFGGYDLGISDVVLKEEIMMFSDPIENQIVEYNFEEDGASVASEQDII